MSSFIKLFSLNQTLDELAPCDRELFVWVTLKLNIFNFLEFLFKSYKFHLITKSRRSFYFSFAITH